MGSSGSSGSTKTTIRYAGYVESHHKTLVDKAQAYRIQLQDDSPYDDFIGLDPDVAFFGTGYVLSDFPALYDMFGKFMAGLDIDTLYNQIFSDTLDSAEVRNVIRAERALQNEDLENVVLPRFLTGMRDVNSVMSSTFVIGKAMIEDTKILAMSKFSADMKSKLITVAIARFQMHLDWNRQNISMYIDVIRTFFGINLQVDEYNLEAGAKHKLWPFTVLEFEKNILGIQNAPTTSTVKGSSSGSKAAGILGGAASGAAMGASAGPWGAAAGGIIGGIASLF